MHKNNELIDKDVRKRIAEEFHRNFFVEASAGSGKTRCLVDRIANHVLQKPDESNKFVTVTFTKKAAGEFRERFQETIEKKLKEEGDDKKELINNILENQEQIFMGTIHSFCARMLRERPVEAGVNIDFTELDETENEAFLRRAWNAFLKSDECREKANELQEKGFPVSELYYFFEIIDSCRDIGRDGIVCEKIEDLRGIDTVEREILQFIRDYKEEPDQKIKGQKNYKEVLALLLFYERNLHNRKTIEKCYTFFNYLMEFQKRANKFPKKCKLVKDNKLKELLTSINSVIDILAKRCHYHAVQLVCDAVDYAEKLRRKESCLSFLDLLLYTRNMLRDSPDARRYFRDKYRYFYVDEFQDTDPLQTEILFYLAAEEYKENWQDIVPRKEASLFIVGDPKQSIYRFKRADIENFELVKKRIRDTLPEGVPEEEKDTVLTTNFRTVDNLCNILNPVFKDMFNSSESAECSSESAECSLTETVSFKDAVSGRKECTGSHIKSGVWVFSPLKETNKKDILYTDSNQVADFIEWAVNSKDFLLAGLVNGRECPRRASYKDFMVLTYTKKDMGMYSRSLQNKGIPCIVSGRSSFSDSLQVRELIKIIRCASNPFYSPNVVAALRSTFLGISDRELFIWKTNKLPFSIFLKKDSIYYDIDFSACKRIKDKLELLNKYHSWARMYPPSVLMEKVTEDLQMVTFALSSGAGKGGRELLHLFYQMLEQVRCEEEKGNIYDTFTMIRTLDQWIDEDVENEMPFAPDSNAVHIMNLHKAKGLEAPVVILAKPLGKKTDNPSVHIQRLSGDIRGYFKIQTKYKVADETRYKDILKIQCWEENQFVTEKTHLEEEHKRLLYVAATRARNLLVVSDIESDLAWNSVNPWKELLEYKDDFKIIDLSK